MKTWKPWLFIRIHEDKKKHELFHHWIIWERHENPTNTTKVDNMLQMTVPMAIRVATYVMNSWKIRTECSHPMALSRKKLDLNRLQPFVGWSIYYNHLRNMTKSNVKEVNREEVFRVPNDTIHTIWSQMNNYSDNHETAQTVNLYKKRIYIRMESKTTYNLQYYT